MIDSVRWIDLYNSRIALRADGIVEARPGRDSIETLDAARAHLRAVQSLAGSGNRAAVLVDLRGVRRADADARRYLATSDAAVQTYRRVALLVGDPLSRMIGNAFLGINRTRYPTRLFTDEEAAVGWLLSA